MFYCRWYNKNIQYIRDLIDENGLLLTYEQFQIKYNLRTNFIEYMVIRTSVETYIRRNQIHLGTESLFNCHWLFNIKLIMKSLKDSRDINTLLTCKTLVPTSQHKWERIFENTHLDWKQIYSVPAKLSQYKNSLVSI